MAETHMLEFWGGPKCGEPVPRPPQGYPGKLLFDETPSGEVVNDCSGSAYSLGKITHKYRLSIDGRRYEYMGVI